jgi:outer membrane lipoprotein-sorting protein
MCPTAFAIAAIFLQASDSQDATALLTAVANNARSAKSWRIEGHVADQYGQSDSAYDFKFVWRSPDLARYEKDDMESGKTLIVCDGAAQWTYRPGTNRYTKLVSDGGDEDECSFTARHWQNLSTGLVSATFIGHETLSVADQSRECDNIRAEYQARSGQRIRTMCIDCDRLLILRERIETDNPVAGESSLLHRVDTTTYSRIERDGELGDDLFVFTPPPGSTGTELPRTYRIGAGVSPPVPVYRPDPKYPKTWPERELKAV